MIDLSTDEGVREAFRAVAAWEPGEAEPAGAGNGDVVSIGPAGSSSTRRRRLWLPAAAALVLIAATIGVLGRDAPDPVAAAQGEWSTMAPSPLEPRFDPITLWTGTELLVWGGRDAAGDEYVDGAAYDPANDRWRSIADFPFEYQRWEGTMSGGTGWSYLHPAPGAWFEGRAIFIVSGADEPWAWDLVAYDPRTDAWSRLDGARLDQRPDDSLQMREGTATVQSPSGLVTVGSDLIVFGWHSERGEYGWATVDPSTATWGEFNGIPGSEEIHGASELDQPMLVGDRHLVWLRAKAFSDGSPLGHAVDLMTGVVTAIDEPSSLLQPDGTGVFGDLAADGTIAGFSLTREGHLERVAARLDPVAGRWSAVAAPPAGPTDDHAYAELTAVRGGTILIGGFDLDGTYGGLRSTTASLALSPEGDRWQTLPDAPVDLARTGHTMVWTGEELLVWGGVGRASDDDPSGSVPLADGASYRIGE